MNDTNRAVNELESRVEADLQSVMEHIAAARNRALAKVNEELVRLYWFVGKHVSDRLELASYGDSYVDKLADSIAQHFPGIKGYNRRGLYRMRQFYELYRDDPKVSTLLTQLSWSQHLLLMSGCKSQEERLFFHRGLRCLVALEFKLGEFKPEYVGKMDLYLEALDRDHRKPDENPSVGMILCATKDDEVVQYALSRSLSPTLVSQYQLSLPDKSLLIAKMREIFNTTTTRP